MMLVAWGIRARPCPTGTRFEDNPLKSLHFFVTGTGQPARSYLPCFPVRSVRSCVDRFAKGLAIPAAGARLTAVWRTTRQNNKETDMTMVMRGLKIIGPRAFLLRPHAEQPRTGVPEEGA
jgi:hypothetical protein